MPQTTKPARGTKTTIGVVQDDLLGLVGYNIKRGYMRISADFSETLATLDLRQRTFSVLSLVVANPDINQSDVARSLGIERSGTVVIVDELERRDLIRRDKVAGDRRAYALHASDTGKTVYKQALERIKAHEDKMLINLSHDERDMLRALLARIHHLET